MHIDVLVLIGKIQALKKTATKGDKKKKKEVAEEITKLEEEIKERHQKELQEFQEIKVRCLKWYLIKFYDAICTLLLPHRNRNRPQLKSQS